MKHICSEQDTVRNPHTEELECVECGKTFGVWPLREYLMEKTNSTTGICFAKLERDITLSSQCRGGSRQHAYAEYAHLLFYDDFPIRNNPIQEQKSEVK
jgi:hypothetical protein